MSTESLLRIIGEKDYEATRTTSPALRSILEAEDVSTLGFPVPLRAEIEPEEAGPIGGFLEGMKSIPRGQVLEQARKGEITMPEARAEIRARDLEPEYKSPGLSFNPIRLAKTALYTAGNFAGQFVGSAWESKEEAAVGAGIGAGIGAATGGPAGALAGAGAGATRGFALGMFRNIWNATSGELYNEMVGNGVNKEDASEAALVGGLLSASLELVQLRTAGKIIGKGVGLLTKNAAEKAVAQTLGKKALVKKLASDAMVNMAQGAGAEAGQEFSQELIEGVTKIFAENADGSVEDKTTFAEAFRNALQAGAETALGAGVLGGVSGGYGTYRGVLEYDKQAMRDLAIDDLSETNIEGTPEITGADAEAMGQDARISRATQQEIVDSEIERGTANNIAKGIFNKSVSELTETEGATLLSIINSDPREIEYKEIGLPDAETIEARKNANADLKNSEIIKSEVVPQAINILGRIINSTDINDKIKADAGKAIEGLINRKSFTPSYIADLNASILEIVKRAREDSLPMFFNGTLNDMRADFVMQAIKKKQAKESSSIGGAREFMDKALPGWANKALGTLENVYVRMANAIGTERASDVFGSLSRAQELEYDTDTKIKTPIRKELELLSTAQANTPVMEMTVGDKKMMFSPNNLALIYSVSQMSDGQGRTDSATGGITVLRNHGFTNEQIERVQRAMDSAELAPYKDAANAIMEQMSSQWDSVNDIYARITGKKLGKKLRFFPVNFLEQSIKEDMGAEGPGAQFAVAQEFDEKAGEVSKSFLYHSHNDPRKIRDFSLYNAANKYFGDVSHYLSFAPIMHDFKRLFSDKKFRVEMERRIGKDAYNEIIRDVDDIRTGATKMSKNVVDDFMHKLIGNQVKAVLYYPTVWVGQFSGMFTAVGQVKGGFTQLARTLGNFAANPIDGWKEYIDTVEKRGWFRDRAGRSQADYERRVRAFETTGAALPVSPTLRGIKVGAIKADKLAGKITTFFDMFPNYMAFKAMVEAQVRDGVDKDAAQDSAIMALEKSQPTTSVISKARLFKMQGTFIEMLTRLKQQDNKSYNLILEALNLIEEGGIDKVSQAKRILLGQALNKLTWIGTTSLASTLLVMALGTSTEDPEERLKSNALYRAAQSITGAFPGLDIVGDTMVSVMSGKDKSQSYFLPFEKLIGAGRTARSLVTGEQLKASSVRDTASLFGVPKIYSEPVAALVNDSKKVTMKSLIAKRKRERSERGAR